MAKKTKAGKKGKGEKEKKSKKEKREKKEKKPQFAYDKAVSALGKFVCLYAVFVFAAIIFSVLYGLLFAS